MVTFEDLEINGEILVIDCVDRGKKTKKMIIKKQKTEHNNLVILNTYPMCHSETSADFAPQPPPSSAPPTHHRNTGAQFHRLV